MDTLIQKIQSAVQSLWQNPLLCGVLAALVLIIFGWLLFRCKRRKRIIPAFKNDFGHVEVSRRAIYELIKNICAQTDSISRVRTRVWRHRGVIKISLRLRLQNGGSRLSEVAAHFQDRLTSALREYLSIENIGSVDVLVTDVKGAPRGKKVSTAPTEEPDPSTQTEDVLEIDDEDPKTP